VNDPGIAGRLSESRERVRLALSVQRPAADPSGPRAAEALAAALASLSGLGQQHPLALVAVAAAAGALLVWSRPWRWLLAPLLVAGLRGQVLAKGLSLAATPLVVAVCSALFKAIAGRR
jgi:hypothetical protein